MAIKTLTLEVCQEKFQRLGEQVTRT